MNLLKSIFSLTILVSFFGILTVNAQWNEGVAAITKVKVPPQVNRLVFNHLKAIKQNDFKAFKATFSRQKIVLDTLPNVFEIASSKRYLANIDLQNLKVNPPLGFNLGVVLEKGFMIIVVPVNVSLKNSDRLPYDMLGVSAELGAGLKLTGLFPSRSIVFLVNTNTMSISPFFGPPGTGKTKK